ncbi:MAG: DEAD/DEAH box helicase [bacterium]
MTRKRVKGKAALVLERRSPAAGFYSDAEEIELRKLRAEKQKAAVSRAEGNGGFHGVYEVRSAQWEHPYRVEIRSLTEPLNTCLCRDFATNRLGTCKHIERVLQHAARGKKRQFAAAAQEGSPYYEIFLDGRADPTVVRLLRPASADRKADNLLAPFFAADGTLLGDPLDALPALERALEQAGEAARGRVRVSHGLATWREWLLLRRQREEARRAFLEDVRQGKRTLNPLRTPLYPYQEEGMLHLAFGQRALLADEMGLGKTVQAIAACELLSQMQRASRVLIVCPASLKGEWEEQIRQFTGRDALLVFGPRAERLRAYRKGAFYTIANYEQVRPDVDDINGGLVPDVVILDEAQRIKNWPTRTSKIIKRLQSPYAFVLTGTPLENRIEEIYSLVEFLDPHLFGALFRFHREFLALHDDGSLQHRNVSELHQRVNQVMLRRRKADVEGELPPRTVNTCFVPMDKEQRRRYEDYEMSASRLLAKARKRPLTKEDFELLQRLLACMRMLCDTPYILDQACRVCPKLPELESLLDDVLADPAAKALIFSEWVRMLDLVGELANKKGIGFALHTGAVDQRKRREEIHRFRDDPQCRLFLSTESGGTGLNLQAANVVINLDLPWNPARLEQRIARAWRKHQTRPVTVINLVTEQSIEHAMLGKLAFKQQLADSVLDGHAPAGGLQPQGRGAFLNRLGELMGVQPESESQAERPGRGNGKALVPSERLKQDLTARFPSQVLGIECAADERSFLVIVREKATQEEILRQAQASVPESCVELVDRATYDLLQRLQMQGVIAFTAKTAVLFRSPELGDAVKAAPVRRYREEAARHFASADRPRKMATLLADGGFFPEAMPPLHEACARAIEALYLDRHGRVPDGPLQPVAEVLGEGGGPAGDLAQIHANLQDRERAAGDAERLVRSAQRILQQVDSHLTSDTPTPAAVTVG